MYFRFMNIPHVANLISELLHTTDCVTIPDFGAFVVNQVSAKLDAVKHKVSPPGPQISFNKNIKNNDGLLANFIATSENITYPEAVDYVKNLANEIQTTLKQSNRFEFGVLGNFYVAPGNILKFEPGPGNPNFDLGLHSMTLTPLADEPWADRHAIGNTTKEEKEISSAEGRSPIPWGKIAMGIIALPLGAYLAWMPTQTNIFSKTENFNFSELNPFGKAPIENYETRATPLTINESEAEEITQQLSEEIPELHSSDELQNLNEEVENPNPPVNEEITDNYHLIGGCFGSKENAYKLIETMKKNGVSAQILDYNKGLHRVSLGGYQTEADARRALKDLKANYNTNAWVLTL